MTAFAQQRFCKHCNRGFQVTSKKPNQKFCTPECYYKAKQVTLERNCDYCGKQYLPRAERSHKGFCSFDCSVKARGAVRLSAETVICKHCGLSFKYTNRRWKIAPRYFCSRRCANTFRRGESYGRRRTKHFSPRQKEKIKKRDGYCCVLCGSTNGIQCDHILAVRLGGSNKIDNGRVLCHSCHVEKTALDKRLIRALMD